jgi:hypothetical protein
MNLYKAIRTAAVFAACVSTALAQSPFDPSGIADFGIPSGDVVRIRRMDGMIYPTNSIPYVTDGLVAYWDGIWNAGMGVHDDNAVIWKDLIGTRDFSLYGDQHWTTNAWVVNACTGGGSNNPTYAVWYSTDPLPASQTIEVVVYPTKTRSSIGRITSEADNVSASLAPTPNLLLHYKSYTQLGLYRYSSSVWSKTVSGYDSHLPHVHTVMHESGAADVKYYIDGNLLHTFTGATSDCDGKSLSLAEYIYAGASKYNRGIDASYYAMRIYNRVLTDEEIKHNAAIDALRFGNPDLCDDAATYTSVSNTYRKVKTWKTVWPTSIPYSTDGLVSMWDGKWNAGIGVHDPNAAVWKDLVGTRDATLSGEYSWSSNSWDVVSYQSDGLATFDAMNLPESQTWEFVIFPTNGAEGSRFMSEAPHVLSPRLMGSARIGQIGYYYSYGVSMNKKPDHFPNYHWYQFHVHTITHQKDSSEIKYYLDGELVNTTTGSDRNSTGTDTGRFADRSQNEKGIDASYYCVRLYNRVLTDDEIKQHARIDSLRFGTPYPYAKDAYSWIDLADESTLWATTDRDSHPAIGGEVRQISDKCLPNTIWGANQWIRTTNGMAPSTIANNAAKFSLSLSTNMSGAYMYRPTDSILGVSFAMALVTSNNRFIAPNTNRRIFQPAGSSWKSARVFEYTMNTTSANAGKLLGNILDSSSKTSYTIIFSDLARIFNILGDNPVLWTVMGSVDEDGKRHKVFSINGKVLYDLYDNVDFSDWEGLRVTISDSTGNEFIPSDYLENIWWKGIPKDWDQIQKALMKKHGITPFDKLTYAKDAFSWIDLTDDSTLFTDTAMTTHPNVGDVVLRVQDKAFPSSTWTCNMTKTNNGLAPSVITDTGVANMVLYAASDEKSAIYKTTDDFSNAKYATMLVFDNYKGYGTASQRIITTRSSGKFFSAIMAGSRLYGYNFTRQSESETSWIAKQATIQELQSIMQSGPCVMTFIGSVKDGTTRNMKIKLNGKVIVDYTDTITEPFDPAYDPHVSICNTASWAQMPADYLENIWWKTIPDNLDEIENILMEKYGIEPLQ